MVPPFLLVIASLFLSFITSHPSFSLLPPSPCSSPSSLPAVPPFLLVLLLSSSFYLFFLPSISLISEFDEDAGEDKQSWYIPTPCHTDEDADADEDQQRWYILTPCHHRHHQVSEAPP